MFTPNIAAESGKNVSAFRLRRILPPKLTFELRRKQQSIPIE
jgi:hypothetical protein